MERIRITVKGVVQGVGFRPFVFRLAQEGGLSGSVRNTSGSVDIEVEGAADKVAEFRRDLVAKLPPLASITDLMVATVPVTGETGFLILESRAQAGQFQLVSPDIATCADCRRELFDPADRRFGYPFTNCTNCGPRFTIIRDIPYDRPLTTMRPFPMCPECQAEYGNPLDRRFHAQPNACPVCGPKLTLLAPTGERLEAPDPLLAAAAALLSGSIVALKGLGGFHLACDATRDAPVELLRRRKGRGGKPFALMMPDLETVRRFCFVSEAEAEVMQSPACPIVLLRRTTGGGAVELAGGIAPGLSRLGVMLPYTPLHHLLMAQVARPLVMTSANLSEEPIVTDNADGVARLHAIADLMLVHDREILTRCDDSVVIVDDKGMVPVRRARGLAPYPIRLARPVRSVLACGGEEKSTFCLTRDREAFVSQHIGDLENAETLAHFEATAELFRRLFRVAPELLACDMHPEYLSTKYARELAERSALPLVEVQHHHAHIASCLADNDADGPVIGVAFDGTGYGTDGTIWGGEFLVVDPSSFERVAWLEPVRLPGGAASIRRPWRMAVSHLLKVPLWKEAFARRGVVPATDRELQVLVQQISSGLNSPMTSSAGRLFDAASAALGICLEVRYEAQAAIELEEAALRADPADERSYAVEGRCGPIELGTLWGALVQDILSEVSTETIALRFHRSVADLVASTCAAVRANTGLSRVALSGGVFQNRLLTGLVVPRLSALGFEVLRHRRVPCNDGGLSLGQAVIADALRR